MLFGKSLTYTIARIPVHAHAMQTFKSIPPFYALGSLRADKGTLLALTELPTDNGNHLMSQHEIGLSQVPHRPPEDIDILPPVRRTPPDAAAKPPRPAPYRRELTPAIARTSLLVPRPAGEMGSPRRGGFSVEQELGWEKKDFNALKTLVNEHVANVLDATKPFSEQPADRLDDIKHLVQYLDKLISWSVATKKSPDHAEISSFDQL
ncbi:hypothetical protein JR316_0009334 [Psilocybe cubensis]|uniref:Uncharacterized protein n=2 Tax=Psilocybe cubensis TaxID=181762 RepID=A0A8H7XX76_PSICU|nr:hypothetical protein JR316_0009334 [Psilocybe cubensis]KAH9478872.1 hypothetical protein JR316_0009334 [Psilocybe cubensis]